MKLIKEISKWKNRINYFSSWISPFSSLLMIAYILQSKLIVIGVNISFVWLIFIGTIVLLVGGYLIDKLGFYSAENEYALEKNQALIELVRRQNDN